MGALAQTGKHGVSSDRGFGPWGKHRRERAFERGSWCTRARLACAAVDWRLGRPDRFCGSTRLVGQRFARASRVSDRKLHRRSRCCGLVGDPFRSRPRRSGVRPGKYGSRRDSRTGTHCLGVCHPSCASCARWAWLCLYAPAEVFCEGSSRGEDRHRPKACAYSFAEPHTDFMPRAAPRAAHSSAPRVPPSSRCSRSSGTPSSCRRLDRRIGGL
jgi:hypothetical protein